MPRSEQIEKLPKWAREYILDLYRQLQETEDVIYKYQDTQTVTRVWAERCGKPAYIQSDSVVFDLKGRHVLASLRAHNELHLMAIGRGMGLSISPITEGSFLLRVK